MDQAIKYTENMNAFVGALTKTFKTVERITGRRFDRVAIDGNIRYFVDRHTWDIFGAKSHFQYNPRRQYGKLDTVSQFDWTQNRPLAGTQVESAWLAREAEIVQNYKPRGRPRKNPAPAKAAK